MGGMGGGVGRGHAPIEGWLYASSHGRHQLQLSFVPPAKQRAGASAEAYAGGGVNANGDVDSACPPALYPSVYALMLAGVRAPEDEGGKEDGAGVCEGVCELMGEVLEWALKPVEGLQWEGPPPSLPEPPRRHGHLASDVISRKIVDQLCSRFMQQELQDAADLRQIDQKRKRESAGEGEGDGEGESEGGGEGEGEGSGASLNATSFAPGSVLDPSILEGSMTDFRPHIR